MQKFFKDNKNPLIKIAVMIFITIFLCIPVTAKFLVQVFGWAAYFYLVIGYTAVIFQIIKRDKQLRLSCFIFLILMLYCILSSLHIGFCDKGLLTGKFTDYIVGAYNIATVGGVVFSILTCFLVVPLSNVWALVIYLVGAAVFGFLFFYPFIFTNKGGAFVPKKERKVRVKKEKVIIEEKAEEEQKEPQPQSFNVNDPEPETPQERARRCLLGEDDRAYSWDKTSSGMPLGYGDYVPPREVKEPIRPAENPLIPTSEEKKGISSPVVTAEERKASAYENLFGDKEKERSSSFAEATRQVIDKETDAPAPIKADEIVLTETPIQKPVQTDAKAIISAQEYLQNQEDKEIPFTPAEKVTEKKDIPPRPYQFPPTSLLVDHYEPKFVNYVDNLNEIREVIEVKLKNHNVDAKLVDAVKGPTVTRVTLELSDTCSIKHLNNAQADLQRLLCSPKPINILQQIGTTSYCGIEIPNPVRNIVGFKEIVNSNEYHTKEGDIVIAFGKSTVGDILIDDLAGMPHALIAGTTGSGKSVCINVILASILFRYRPDEVKLILIDMKEVELGVYSGLPHMLFKEPLSDLKQIVNAMLWIRQETKSRFELYKKCKVRNLDEYNRIPGVKKQARIVIIIDEASELMTNLSVRKTLEATLSSLARVSRAAGVHLIFATQNPVKEVITNEIQNNLNTKIAFAVGDYNHSLVIFKSKGAENLLGHGDMIIKKGGSDMSRGQCAYISTKETEAIVNYIIENNDIEFDEEMIARILNGSYTETETAKTAGQMMESTPPALLGGSGGAKPNFTNGPTPKGDMSDTEYLAWQALKISYIQNYISCSYLQRQLSRGYNTIAGLLDFCEKEGYVNRITDRKRTLILPKEDFQARYMEKFGVDPFEDEDSMEKEEQPEGDEE